MSSTLVGSVEITTSLIANNVYIWQAFIIINKNPSSHRTTTYRLMSMTKREITTMTKLFIKNLHPKYKVNPFKFDIYKRCFSCIMIENK